MRLDIGIKNQLKAALIEGTEKRPVEGKSKCQPEVVLKAQLPSLVGNFSPDVYNAFVNISQVIMAEGAEDHLRRLKNEKD